MLLVVCFRWLNFCDISIFFLSWLNVLIVSCFERKASEKNGCKVKKKKNGQQVRILFKLNILTDIIHNLNKLLWWTNVSLIHSSHCFIKTKLKRLTQHLFSRSCKTGLKYASIVLFYNWAWVWMKPEWDRGQLDHSAGYFDTFCHAMNVIQYNWPTFKRTIAAVLCEGTDIRHSKPHGRVFCTNTLTEEWLWTRTTWTI